MTNQKRLGLRIPLNLYLEIKNKADFQGKTMNALCLEIFWDYFENQKMKELQEA